MSKNRVPRKLKKARKGVKIVMDLASLPEGLTLEKWLYLYNQRGVALYTDKGNEPEFYNYKEGCKLRTEKI